MNIENLLNVKGALFAQDIPAFTSAATEVLVRDTVGNQIKRRTPAQLVADGGAALVGHTHSWADITSGLPTTLAGYGITDGVIAGRTLTIAGTTNQVNVVGGTQDLSANRTWTLSLPQDIHTSASPTFSGATINGSINTRATALGAGATHVAVFSADPSSTTRQLVTRTPRQLLSDTALLGWSQETNGIYVGLGGGSDTVVGSGESRVQYEAAFAAGNRDVETLWLLSDQGINVEVGLQAGWASRVNALTITSTGNTGFNVSPTQRVDINGNIRVRSLTTAAGDFVTADANGVFSRRTAAQVRTDLDLNTNYIQNQTAVAQSASFRINGTATAASFENTNYNSTTSYGASLTSSGNLDISLPTTSSGGFARGIVYRNVGGANVAGIGARGDSSVVQRLYMAFGAAPWDSPTGITVLSSGNVGVGTITPANRLHVYNDNNTTPLLIGIGANASYAFSANSTSGYTTTFNMTDTGLSIGHNSNSRDFRIQTASTPRITILGTGNVGIGTTSPSEKLHVVGNGLFTGTLQISGVFSAYHTTDTSRRVTLNTNLTTGQFPRLYNFEQSNSTFHPIIIGGSNSESDGLYLSGDGNVGVRVAPTQALDINGNIRVRSLTTAAGDFVTTDANGLFSRRTAAQVVADLGVAANTNTVTVNGTSNQIVVTGVASQQIGSNPSWTVSLPNSIAIGGAEAEYAINLGQGRTGNGFAYLDLIGDETYTDYGLRVIRQNTGSNADSRIIHRGTGALQLQTIEAAPMSFFTSGVERFTLLSGGGASLVSGNLTFAINSGISWDSGTEYVRRITGQDAVEIGINSTRRFLATSSGVEITGQARIDGTLRWGSHEIETTWGSLGTINDTNDTAYINLGNINGLFTVTVEIDGGWSSGQSWGRLAKTYTFFVSGGVLQSSNVSNVVDDQGYPSNGYMIGAVESLAGLIRIPVKRNTVSGTISNTIRFKVNVRTDSSANFNSLSITTTSASAVSKGRVEYTTIQRRLGVGLGYSSGLANQPEEVLHVGGIMRSQNIRLDSTSDSSIYRVDKNQRLIISGGDAAASANGGYIVLEGYDYGGASLGGNILIAASAAASTLITRKTRIGSSTAPTEMLDVTGNGLFSGSLQSASLVAGWVQATTQAAVGVAVASKITQYGLEVRASGASAQIMFGRDGSSIGSGAIGADSGHIFSVWETTGFTRQLTMTSGFNLGLGTTGPVSKFELSTSDYNGITLTRTAQNAGMYIQARGHDSSGTLRTSALIEFAQTSATGAVNGRINFGTRTADVYGLRWSILNDGIFESNGAQTIRTSSGNLTLATNAGDGHILLDPHGVGLVGINTSTPSQILDVVRAGATNAYINIGQTGAGTTAAPLFSGILFSASSGLAKGLIVSENKQSNTWNSDMVFYTINAAAGNVSDLAERMRLLGEVGTSPVLQLNGTSTIRTSTGTLTLATNGGDGNIILSPNGSGGVSATLGSGAFTVNKTGTGTHFLVTGGNSGAILARFQRTIGSFGYVDIQSASGYMGILLSNESGTDWNISNLNSILRFRTGLIGSGTDVWRMSTGTFTGVGESTINTTDNGNLNLSPNGTGETRTTRLTALRTFTGDYFTTLNSLSQISTGYAMNGSTNVPVAGANLLYSKLGAFSILSSDSNNDNYYINALVSTPNGYRTWRRLWHDGDFNISNYSTTATNNSLYAPITGSANYIQSQTAVAQSASFRISGTATANEFIQSSFNSLTAFGSKLDNSGSYIISVPTTYSGGWARGNFMNTAGTTTTVAGIGAYGNNTDTIRLFMSFGASPWSSTGLYVTSANNVAIGATSASEKLHVVGNGLFTGTLEVDTVNNGVGDFLTRTAGGVLTRRTASEVRGDIQAPRYFGVTLNSAVPALSAGWRRLATTSISHRGSCRVIISYIGGNFHPGVYIIDVTKDWSTTASLRVDARAVVSQHITGVRVVQDTVDTSVYYLEANFASSASPHQFQIAFDDSYGNNSLWTMATTEPLVASTNGTVISSVSVGIAGEYTSDGLTASGLIQAGNLRMATNTVSSQNTNGDVIITPNGTGAVLINRASQAGTHKLQVGGGISMSSANALDWGNGDARILSVTVDANNRALAFQTWNNVSSIVTRWTIGSTGILESNGAQTIRTSTGSLTLASNAGDGDIRLTPHNTGIVYVGSGTKSGTIGRLEIAYNGAANGIGIFDGTGLSFRIYRDGNVGYLSRGSSPALGINADSRLLPSVDADGAATNGLFLNGSGVMVSRTLGSMAFASTANYLPLTGGTLTGNLNLPVVNPAFSLNADANVFTEVYLAAAGYHYYPNGSGSTNYPSGFGATYTFSSVAGNNTSDRITQVYADRDADRWYLRRINNSTSLGWREIWHSGNFTPADYLTTAAASANYLTITTAGATYATRSTTITINGTAQDLSANRTWNISVSNLTDTTISSVADGQFLKYVTGLNRWVNASLTAADISSGTLPVERGGTGATTLTGVLFGNGTAAVTALTGAASTVLVRNSGGTYTFGTIQTAQISDAQVTYAKIQSLPAYTVMGRALSTSGTVGEITASTDHTVLRRSGTSIGFGAIALNQTAAVTGTLPVGNGGTGAATFTASTYLRGNGTSAIQADSYATVMNNVGAQRTITINGTEEVSANLGANRTFHIDRILRRRGVQGFTNFNSAQVDGAFTVWDGNWFGAGTVRTNFPIPTTGGDGYGVLISASTISSVSDGLMQTWYRNDATSSVYVRTGFNGSYNAWTRLWGSLDFNIADYVLKTTAVNTQHSLTGGGNLTANRTLSLVGDVASPGNSKVYGTNSSGVRGWYDATAAVTDMYVHWTLDVANATGDLTTPLISTSNYGFSGDTGWNDLMFDVNEQNVGTRFNGTTLTVNPGESWIITAAVEVFYASINGLGQYVPLNGSPLYGMSIDLALFEGSVAIAKQSSDGSYQRYNDLVTKEETSLYNNVEVTFEYTNKSGSPQSISARVRAYIADDYGINPSPDATRFSAKRIR